MDIKCTDMSTGRYCGTYSRQGTIKENSYLPGFGTKQEILNGCVQLYGSICPKEQMRYSYIVWVGLSHYKGAYPE